MLEVGEKHKKMITEFQTLLVGLLFVLFLALIMGIKPGILDDPDQNGYNSLGEFSETHTETKIEEISKNKCVDKGISIVHCKAFSLQLITGVIKQNFKGN